MVTHKSNPKSLTTFPKFPLWHFPALQESSNTPSSARPQHCTGPLQRALTSGVGVIWCWPCTICQYQCCGAAPVFNNICIQPSSCTTRLTKDWEQIIPHPKPPLLQSAPLQKYRLDSLSKQGSQFLFSLGYFSPTCSWGLEAPCRYQLSLFSPPKQQAL